MYEDWYDDDRANYAPRWIDNTLRDELQRLVDEFLAAGGVITQCPPEPNYIDSEYWYPPKPATEEPISGRVSTVKHPGDEPYVRLIDAWLAEMPATSRRQMGEALELSDQVLSRILATHFADDPRAEPYQKKELAARHEAKRGEDDRRAKVIELLMEQGLNTYHELMAATGLSRCILKRLDNNYGLGVGQ